MVLVAVRPDELTGSVAGRPRGRLVARLIPIALLVALIGIALPLVLHVSDARSHRHERTAVLDAARDEVTALVNINYATARHDLERVIAGATGGLRQQFATESAHLSALVRDRSVLTGSVDSAALLWLDNDTATARAIVAADGQANDRTSPAGAAAVKHYRWVLTLRRVDGDWLVSDAALEGVPQ